MNKEEFIKGTSPETGETQVPLWFWNEKLDEKEIERQLKLMSKKGIPCNAPHARSGYVGEYLDEEWMSHMG